MHTSVVHATHRPERDGTRSDHPHLGFYEVLENVTFAWVDLLATTGREDLSLGHFAIANVTGDFAREMFVGDLEVNTAVEKVGNTSVILSAAVRQGGIDTGSAKAVIVQVTEDRTTSVPLSEEQKQALALLQ